MRHNTIKTFYTPKQVLKEGYAKNYSKSPKKPELLLKHIENHGLLEHFEIVDNFAPFSNFDFFMAHNKSYVTNFFNGGDMATSNGLDWSPAFAKSVRYTNASLYNAIRNSILNPAEVSFSPTSGFHHARPNGGSGFCTFSGQVIASVKLWKEFGYRGAYLDLDGHFGNSIEDSRDFVKDLDRAVPRGFNFNPTGTQEVYVENLKMFLSRLTTAVLNGKINYVVWCHGADSHQDDQLGHQCSTENWLLCAELFWTWVKEMDSLLGEPLPVACALFGGYRDDDYNSVLSLHTGDFVQCLNILLEKSVKYTVEVLPKNKQTYSYYESRESQRESRKRYDEKVLKRIQERNRLALLEGDFDDY
jgi:acetoin utilization deacetylase AcuC-like enzyme